MVAQDPVPTDQTLLHTLQDGVWCTSEDLGRSCAAYEEFESDEQVTACGKFSGQNAPFTATGAYKIRDRFVCMVVTDASTNFAARPGTKSCSEVLEINERLYRYRYLDSSEIYTMYRRAKSAKQCPGENL